MKNTFLKVPVSLIPCVYDGRHTINDVISFCIVERGKTLEKQAKRGLGFLADSVLRDAVYNYYFNREELPESISDCFGKFGEIAYITWDFDQKGFDLNGNFSAEEEVTSLRLFLDGEADGRIYNEVSFLWQDLANEINEWGYTRRAMKELNISGNVNSIIREGEAVCRSDITSKVFAPVSTSFLFAYRDRISNEMDRMRLALILAVNSVIGIKKQYAVTTTDTIKYRMFGCTTKAEFAKFTSSPANKKFVSSFIEKYSKRRAFDKIKENLMAEGHLKTWFGYGRRIIVSYLPWADIKHEVAHKMADTKKAISRQTHDQRAELKQMLIDFNKCTS